MRMENPRLRPGRPAPALLVTAAMAAALGACTGPRQEITPPDATPPSVAILEPQPGSTVADTVAVAIDASDDTLVRRVTLLVDGRLGGTCFQAPWIVPWATGELPDSSFHELAAEAVDGAGNSAVSASCRVCVRRNAPPSIVMRWPEALRWIDLDAPARAWSCEATDPEEGELAGDRITWHLDGSTLAATGPVIEPPATSEGAHRVRACARDRWGRGARAECDVVTFRYPDRLDPAGALQAFLCALRARDADRAEATLDEGFCAHAPDAAGIPDRDRTGDAAAWRALLEHPSLRGLRIEGRPGPAETFEWRGGEWAKIEIASLEIEVRLACVTAATAAPRPGLWRVAPSAARVFLRRDPGTGRWGLAAWWDLHDATWCRGTRPSWSALLQAALLGRLCS
jgi:hypothetical protein